MHTRLAVLAVVAALALSSTRAGAATLTRAPYLQSVTPTSAIVAFRSEVACEAVVRYGTSGLDREVRSPPATIHAVRLADLAPGTTYQYAVEICGAASTSPRRLRTAPVPGTRRVHFAAVGDTGVPGSAQTAVSRIIEAKDPELLIGAGDIGYPSGTEAEIRGLFASYATVFDEIPFYNALGNHEYLTDRAAPMIASLYLPANNPHGTERYHSFDWGHVHFVALDSNCSGAAATPECTIALQQEWLERDLAATTAAFKVVYFHHPPWSSGYHGSSTATRTAFGAILERHGVDLVVNGHDHDYQRTKPLKGTEVVPPGTPGGITYVVVGTGGVSLRKFSTTQPPWIAYRNDGVLGFLDVHVEEGVLTAQMVSTTGAVIDQFTIAKTLPPLPDPAAPIGSGPGGAGGEAPASPGPAGSEPPGGAEPASPLGAAGAVGAIGPAGQPDLFEASSGGGCATHSAAASLTLLAAPVWLAISRLLRRARAR